ncbi:MAG: lysophospholipid acyltransferase family protein [bacterium]
MDKKSFAKELRRFLSGDMKDEILERLDGLEDFRTMPNSEYDLFGASRETLANLLPLAAFFYKFYFRTEVCGLENVAGLKRGLITPNHMVQIPVDGMNICMALFMEPEKPRFVRGVGHTALAKQPFMSKLVSRSGQVIGTPENTDRLFAEDNLVLIFPEGIGAVRPYSRRYRLSEFHVGFMEYAIEFSYPVVPTAVIGSEESTLVLANVKALSGFMNIQRFVLTPTFPWLGPLGALPYPAKFRIHFGEPMDFSMHKDKLNKPDEIRGLVELVRQRVQQMLDRDLAGLPKFPFF